MAKRRYGLEAELHAIAQTIRTNIRQLKKLNECGDYSHVITWVITRELASSPRPLRHHHIYKGSSRTLPATAKPELDRWIEAVQSEGVLSIISLVSEKELGHYCRLLPDTTLIDYYKSAGFHVKHVPWSDPADSGYSDFDSEVREKRRIVQDLYNHLPKPVLVHCSAGIDRSPPILAYVSYQTLKRGGTNRSRENS